MSAIRWFAARFLLLLLVLVLALLAWWWFGDWRDRAEKDLAFIHQTILDHHPGAVDPDNPAFARNATIAYERSAKMAADASSPAKYRAAISAYTGAFEDGHLSAFFFDRAVQTWASSRAGPNVLRRSGITETDDMVWISMPSFSERRTAISELTEEIESRADELRKASILVFDLRGNTGGNSAFGTRIVTALWTQEVYLDWVQVSAKAVEWRASAANAEHVRGISDRFARKDRADMAAHWSSIADGIASEVETGNAYFRQDFQQREITRTLAAPVTARVVVITDAQCASACLDFMDRVHVFPSVLHIGEETSSDTQYIDVRSVILPSRMGAFTFPLKVYRERQRPPGGTYTPEIEVPPASIDPARVRSILETRVEESDGY